MITPKKNIPIAPYTNYHIGGAAREVYFPETTDELLDVLGYIKENNFDYYLLGGGSNVLVGDGFFDGVVIITTNLTRIEPHGNHILCGAGVQSSKIAETALEQGKTGLEFLYLLPGSIGGALAGNARYDYTNVSSVLIHLTAVHPVHGRKIFKSDDIEFAYKFSSITHNGWYITEAALRWSDGNKAEIRKRMDEIEQKRTDTRHFDYPSCGCIFKNDYKRNIRAGQLIDSLGLKGKQVGGAQIAPFHANFIINTGGATARDVLTLIELIERTLKEKAGVTLEREVQLTGTFPIHN